jgi:hypothetical protein
MNKTKNILKLFSSDYHITKKGRDGKDFQLNSANEIREQWSIEFKETNEFQAGILESPLLDFDSKEKGNFTIINY